MKLTTQQVADALGVSRSTITVNVISSNMDIEDHAGNESHMFTLEQFSEMANIIAEKPFKQAQPGDPIRE
jgi:hypothetical protein